MPQRSAVVPLAVGFAGGLLSGLLGVGGGVVMVPGLVLLMGVGQRRAHGTSLAAIIPTAVVAAAVYALDGERIQLGTAALLAAGAVVGAPIGVRLLARIPERVLRFLFVGAMVVAAVRLLLG